MGEHLDREAVAGGCPDVVVVDGAATLAAEVVARGAGVQLQRYRDGGLSDAIAFKLDDGISWAMGGGKRNRTETDMLPWKVARGAAGRMPPMGFPQENVFTPPVPKTDED